MKLYLVRHGEALDQHVDPERPLSPDGRRVVGLTGRILNHLAAEGDSAHTPAYLWHSTKTRARETAFAIGGAMGLVTQKPVEHEELDPLASPTWLINQALECDVNIIAVGHLPHLSLVASHLLSGKDTPHMVDFQPGGFACLKKSASQFSIELLVSPDLPPYK